jgi:murein DD-endopeptidase MepM/ murein hydrolase activator NlpD
VKKLIAVVCILILTTCSTSPTSAPTLLPTVTLTGVPTSSRTAAPTTLPNPISPLPTSVNNTRAGSPTPGVTLSPTPENTTTPTQPPFQVCSPLQDITLAELPSILTTPFQAPTPGQDNGHHGADFAYYHRGSHTTMLGLPVLSSLSGRVAAVIHDRPPYGNAIIIET